jgi:urease gamma subunit
MEPPAVGGGGGSHYYVALPDPRAKPRALADLVVNVALAAARQTSSDRSIARGETIRKPAVVAVVVVRDARDGVDDAVEDIARAGKDVARVDDRADVVVASLRADQPPGDRADALERFRAARRREDGETFSTTFARGGVFALVTSEACLPSPGAGEGALGASLVINMETPKSREAYARRTRAGLGGGGRAGGGGGGGGVVLNVIAPHQLSALRAVLPDGVALDAMPIDLIDTLAADVAAGGRER